MLTPRVVAELSEAIRSLALPTADDSAQPAETGRAARTIKPKASQGVAAAVRLLSSVGPAEISTVLPRVIRTIDERVLAEVLGVPQEIIREEVAGVRARTRDRRARAQNGAPQIAEARPVRRAAAAAAERGERPPVQLDASRWAMGLALAWPPRLDDASEPAPTAARARRADARSAQTRSQVVSSMRETTPRTIAPRAERTARVARDGTLASPNLAAQDTEQVQTRRTARRASRPNQPPTYARHADPNLSRPETLRPEELASRSLLSALARSGDPDQVVQLVLERGAALTRAARTMPGEAQSLIERIVQGAHRIAAAGESEDRPRGGIGNNSSVSRNSRAVSSAPAFRPLRAARASATVVDGVGASQVMKMAGKLMKLIHLAESERKADAQRQMRMASGGTPETMGISAPSNQVDETAVLILQEAVWGELKRRIREEEIYAGQEDFNVRG